jgi:5'(3')-deoxyribonucleotidase
MEVSSDETRLETELLSMIGRYGIESLHKALVSRMKKEYSYLKIQFEDKKKEDKKKEEIKKEEIKKEEIKNEVVNNDEKIVEVKQDNKKFRNSKEVREWQKVQEEKKSQENKVKGLLKKELLTKENLKKWIEEEDRTFSYIAREYVGCRDTEVSAAAKLFGIIKKSKL